MPKSMARCYLTGCKPIFGLPNDLDSRLRLVPTSAIAPLRKESKQVHATSTYCLELTECDQHTCVSLLQSTVYGMQLACDCAIRICAIDFSSGGPIEDVRRPVVLWGHCSEALPLEAAEFAARHYRTLDAYAMPERYDRVSNAIRLHQNAMSTDTCDLALLGFMASLESLFSIAPQELSFRLALTISKFLGDDATSQRAFFDRARRLYAVRSKLAHGDKIDNSEEHSAIVLSDCWTPEAEKLNRACLRRIIEEDLADVFLSNQMLERFLVGLLFSNGFREAVAAAKS